MKNSMFFKNIFCMKKKYFVVEFFCIIWKVLKKKKKKKKKSNYSESARAGLAVWVNKVRITAGTEADG